MKFVHIADIHFDNVFSNLSDKDILGNLKRLEQRKIFKDVIEYIKKEKIECFFIAGDLYEQKYIKKSTIEFINNLFKEIPDTKIFISPGNHDPYIKNSYYNNFNWNENVKIFNSKIEKVELKDVNIYGFGFDDYYCTNCEIENIEIKDSDKLNILIVHGTIDGASFEEKQYNSISKKILNEKGFDYVALGHIHKLDYNSENNQKIVYPGSLVSLGFDELGSHGMIVGDIEKNKLNLRFIPIRQNEFKEINFNCTEIISEEELIEKLNENNYENNYFYKINLNGKRNFEINENNLYKLNINEKIIKIKNNTKLNYDLEKISCENNLKGLFIKEMLEKLNNEKDEEEKEKIEMAIEIGLEVLE